MIATADPGVVIEEIRPGYVRYRAVDGRRWEVEGTCDKRGSCMVGAVIDGRTITAKEAHAVALSYVGPDVPVTPGFTGCCPLIGRWL